MDVNVGRLDRVLRVIVGGMFLYLGFASGLPLFDGALAKILAAAAGLVMLAVAASRFCPLYALLGVRTCRDA